MTEDKERGDSVWEPIGAMLLAVGWIFIGELIAKRFIEWILLLRQ